MAATAGNTTRSIGAARPIPTGLLQISMAALPAEIPRPHDRRMLARTKVKGATPRPAPRIEEAEADNKRALWIEAEEGGIASAIDKFPIRQVDRTRAPSVAPPAGRAAARPARAVSGALQAWGDPEAAEGPGVAAAVDGGGRRSHDEGRI